METDWPSQLPTSASAAGMDNGNWSICLGHAANDAIYVRLPGFHAQNGQDGIDPVVLFAVNRFYIESIDFENAKDVSVFYEPLRNAVSVVPHVIRLLVKR